ncbi:hypothetical protein Poly51_16310 [Rubripirellula tenax]|uniref:Methyltransferase domain-containing protein n=1 Tax=Rubripirellula tenax TaxID=2528015 RepID=A0A5C6FGZ7_9BACT|nr:class I SAM-dependent methyltransferase [Rubripirellula tenax]TWU58851.1 hypothetical protein Poly51_16310 [Rubripirellula tenax]
MSHSPHPSSDSVSKSEIADFYDGFSDRLVSGYVTGNPRLSHALAFATENVPESAESILEVGCGVGETTNHLCSARPDLRAVGVDISTENVRMAKRLFADSTNAHFEVNDLTSPVGGGPFDVVTLLDVYEHIPAVERPRFHANLRQSMGEKSRLIVTCPSFLHQQHLYANEPEGLQIVDEIIGPADFLQLASDLGGHLTHLQYESVWRTNDYVYAVIDIQMAYQWKPKPRGIERWSMKLAKFVDKTPLGGPARRSRLVKRNLAA